MWIFKICCTHIEIQNSKAQTLTSISCLVKTEANKKVLLSPESIIEGKLPSSKYYIPFVVMYGNIVDENCSVLCDNSKWYVFGSVSQNVRIAFYKCTK